MFFIYKCNVMSIGGSKAHKDIVIMSFRLKIELILSLYILQRHLARFHTGGYYTRVNRLLGSKHEECQG